MPASPRFLAAARVVAASLGAEAGLSVDDLDDLRLGVNELVSLLVEAAASRGPRRPRVRGRRTCASRCAAALEGDGRRRCEIDELTRRIVEAVVDHHELDGTSFSLTQGIEPA